MPFGVLKKHVVNDKRRDLIKLEPGHPLPPVMLEVKGDGMVGKVVVGSPTGRWVLVVVYSGRHSQVCLKYLTKLAAHAIQLKEAGIDVVAVTSDTLDKVEATCLELAAALNMEAGVSMPFNVAYGISSSQMKDWGLYLSDPNAGVVNDVHPEPALFLINPAGMLHVIDYSNSPFCRPDLEILLAGIAFIKETNAPIHGMHNVVLPEA